jgi:hypothetical protein
MIAQIVAINTSCKLTFLIFLSLSLRLDPARADLFQAMKQFLNKAVS